MKITRVEGEDFLTLGKVDFNLADQGLILIQGENQDDSAAMSNGAGKSSLMDLVCWVLWGTTARGSSGDAVIRDGAKQANGKVMIYDDASGGKWEIERIRKKGRTALALRSHIMRGITDQTQGTEKLTQARIAQILGTTEEVFRGSIYMGQEQLVDLPMMTDRHLKMIVEEAAGVVALERAYEIARQRLSKAKDNALIAADRLTSHKNKLSLNEALLVSEENHSADWIVNKNLRISKFTSQIDVWGTIVEEDAKLIDLPRIAELEAKEKTLRDKLAEFSSDRARENTLREAYSKAETAVKLARHDLSAAEKNLTQAQKRVENIENPDNQKCPECGGMMSEEHTHSVRDTALARVSLRETQTLTEKAKLATALEVSASSAEALATFLETASDPTAISDELATIKLALDTESRKVSKLDNCKFVRDSLIDDLAKATSEVNPFLIKIETYEIMISGLKIALVSHIAELEEANQSVADTEDAVKVFGPAGVRAHILDTVTPYLNARTSEYLAVLSDGVIQATWNTLVRNAKGDLKEKFNIEVVHLSGSRGFTELSGGEKRKVRLACVLALQDLVGSRANKPFELFVADEIDQALDEAGLERLTSVLQAKVATCGTVVVISHNALDSYIPNVWTVTKNGGKSSLLQ